MPLATPSTDAAHLSGAPAGKQPATHRPEQLLHCCHWQHYAQPTRHTVFTRVDSDRLLPLATLCTVQPTHGLHRGGDGGRLLPLATPSSADCQAVFTGADGLPTVATGNTMHSPTNTRSSPGGRRWPTVATGNTKQRRLPGGLHRRRRFAHCCHWQHYAQSNQHTVFTGGATVADCCHWQHQAAPTARRSSPAPTAYPLLPLATLRTAQPTHGLLPGATVTGCCHWQHLIVVQATSPRHR